MQIEDILQGMGDNAAHLDRAYSLPADINERVGRIKPQHYLPLRNEGDPLIDAQGERDMNRYFSDGEQGRPPWYGIDTT